ncbi:C-C motif chemokine 19b [Hoplias malabaricus]|uniref:C-C motif chemokine 19b n=1 Tax=Hoplias malabaricus TaxID=27720 RepID=UPI003462B00C
MLRNGLMTHVGALLLFGLIVCSWSYAGAEGEDCCLATADKPIPQRLVKSFYLQTADTGCRIPATVFTTKKNKKLCAPLPTKNNWVKKLMDKLNKKSKKTSKGKKQ